MPSEADTKGNAEWQGDGTLKQEEWRIICHNLVETGFFDSAGRPKTLEAIRRVIEKMPTDEVESLKNKVSIIFAPAPGMDGQVFSLKRPSASIGKQEESQQQPVLIYFSPELERRSQERIDSIVAHEFAHALLHAPSALEGWFIEQEADQKVQSWGFKVAYPKERYPDNKKRGNK